MEVLLLANCPVLIGTYYSSYSETAKLMGWPYYIQVSSCKSFNSILAIRQALVEYSCAWDLFLRPYCSGLCL